MGLHYVPKLYLKGFVKNENSPGLWTYEKDSGRHFFAHLDRIANEKDFYPEEVERDLNEKIENPTVPVMEKLRRGEWITDSERRTLSVFMAFQIERVPRHRERVNNLIPEIRKDVFSTIEQMLSIKAELDPSVRDSAFEMKRDLHTQRKRWKKNLPPELLATIMNPSPSENMISKIQSMTWCIWRQTHETRLVTSDNPVFFFEGIGIAQRDSEVSFPLARDMVLWGTWRADIKEGFYDAREHLIREFNRRTVKSATKYIYYDAEERWLENMVRNRHLHLNLIIP